MNISFINIRVYGLLATLSLWLFATGNTMANPLEKDSVIINFGTGSRVVVYLRNAEDAQKLKAIDFNELMAKVSVYVDSAKNTGEEEMAFQSDMGEFRIYTEESEPEEERSHFELKRPKVLSWGSCCDDNSRTDSYIDFYLGFNNFFENGEIPANTNYELRPWGSRFVEINLMNRTRLNKKARNAFHIKYGLSFSWYNFMFDGNRRIVRDGPEISFIEEGFFLEKSKLTASFINAPVLFELKREGDNDKDLRIALGGYAGYRLGSYSKIKYNENGNSERERERNNFNLNNFRYGVRAELGWAWVTLFASYDLNPLFKENSTAPELNAFSFGIVL